MPKTKASINFSSLLNACNYELKFIKKSMSMQINRVGLLKARFSLFLGQWWGYSTLVFWLRYWFRVLVV